MSEMEVMRTNCIGHLTALYERNDNTKLITEHHYNIEIEAKKLQERYLQLAGEVE